ncbi:asparagine--tRNA ligase [Ureaplasma sp. OM1]|uniref:Asparagine--tRNA ligase n=2 Tax=Ureaplasma ceti TaxID=3119530 RepID=A0ABP9U827_9BACT
MIEIKELLEKHVELENQIVELYGFVKTNRFNGTIGFINLNDGTAFKGVQVVYKKNNINNIDEIDSARPGSSLLVHGTIKLTPEAKQPFEIVADKIELLKQTDEDYPLQNKKHSVEFLREIAHLRPKTNLFSAVMRVRSELAYAIHEFFHGQNFVWTASPILTSNDGEGAGETFIVTTDDKESFFGKTANLSVTGQLQAEAYAQAYKKVYTFGPTFRAEKSHTARHAAEFWMVEPEVAFCDLDGIMGIAEAMLKHVIAHYKKTCQAEIKFFNEFVDGSVEDRIEELLTKDFSKLSYADGIEILKKAVAEGHVFEDNNIYFGMDLGSEHERYICEQIVKGPVFLYNYPKAIKAFYMKQNDDGITVRASDLLVPGIGELIGGSQREDSYEKLMNRCNELNMNIAPLQWYLDLRRYGYYMSSGFGLGFERLIMYLTGVNNIRDVIPFPRTHGLLDF